MRGKAVLVGVVTGLCVGALPDLARAGQQPDARLAGAIREAVEARLDRRAWVEVRSVSVRWAGTEVTGRVTATVEPNQRLGRPLRFLLREAGLQGTGHATGAAQAVVQVWFPVVRLARPVARGDSIGPADALEVWEELRGMPLRPLPGLHEAVGAQATRDLAANGLVTALSIRRPPIIRRGDEVVARVIVDGIEVRGTAIARQAGRVGETIRVVNAESGRRLRGRVVNSREVEVVHVP